MPLVSIRPRADLRAERGPRRVVHDRTTVTLYGAFAAWGWFLYSFNPSVPLLGRDLGISDSLAGLHGTAMAAGGLVAAFVAPRAVLRWGRRAAIVGASLTIAVGVVGLVAGRSLPWTLAAVCLLAAGGNTLIASVQVGLALHHGPTASAVLTEGNAVGSGVGLLGPVAVGAAVSAGWGWRVGVLVTAVLMVVVALLVGRLPASESLPRRTPAVPHDEPAAPVAGHTRWRPGAAALLFLGGIVATIAVENATDYWSTALLIARTGAGPGIAAAATSGLIAGMTVVRLVVGPLSLRVTPSHLVAAGFAVNIVGWAVVWSTTSPGVAVAGLVLAGLGLGVQYPLCIALLFAATVGHSDRAAGRASLYGALSVGIAPFLLGALSDHVGIHTAFVVVPVFALLGGVSVLLGGRALRRLTATA